MMELENHHSIPEIAGLGKGSQGIQKQLDEKLLETEYLGSAKVSPHRLLAIQTEKPTLKWCDLMIITFNPMTKLNFMNRGHLTLCISGVRP